MRSQDEIIGLLASGPKEAERVLGIKIRNGQAVEAYRKALAWVLMARDQK